MSAFDDIWEKEIYGKGRHLNLYPYDAVVSFIFRNAPREVPRGGVRVLEIGCGAGNNIWFLAREGFGASGIEGSVSAVDFARKRLAAEGLHADLRVGDFTRLPYGGGEFDLAFERGSLVCAGRSAACRAVLELHRVLKPGGRLFANPYSIAHPSAIQGAEAPDGRREGIKEGPLAGLGGLCFWDEAQVRGAFALGWKILSLEHVETRALIAGVPHAEWRVVLERAGGEPAALRPACAQDCALVLGWRNHPFIVERSTSRQPVEPETHRRWFRETLASPGHLILIVEGAGGGMGLVRFEPGREASEAVVTVYLLPQHTGRGLGPRLLSAACQMAALRLSGVERVVAHVRDDNPPGHAGFLKAGFLRASGDAGTPPAHTSYCLALR